MMRITNSIINGNSKYNINSNKISVDTLNTQMSDQKKIHSPSEDPVVAIRSLRLRSSIAQIEQYQTNISDALSWLDVTETALLNMKDRITEVSKLSNQGANDPLEVEDRRAILDELKQIQKQIYDEGNADYAGRSIFTGFKTGESLTFTKTDLNTSYEITQKFSPEDIESMTYISNSYELGNGVLEADPEDLAKNRMPNAEEVNKINLGYNKIDEPPADQQPMKIHYTDADGQKFVMEARVKSVSEGDAAYVVAPGDEEVAYIIPETGELILGSKATEMLRGAKEISFGYSKTGFQAGELRPEHYYDCTKVTNENGEEVNLEYTKQANKIEYTVSFNQVIDINTEASEVFNSRMAHDINDMIDALQSLEDCDAKKADIQKMIEDPKYSSAENQTKLKAMLRSVEKEKDLLDDKVQKLFERNIGRWQGYLDDVNLAITDCGSRVTRVELTESRMQSQESTFKKLKSVNDDRELSEVIVDYTAAYTAYQASLQATGKAMKQTLLDYI